mgnify:CR=1 FL=1
MDRLIHIGIGFVLAVVLLVAYFVVKDVAENKKSLREQRMLAIAREECRKAKKFIYWSDIIDLDTRVNDLIDSKLAEKEDKG